MIMILEKNKEEMMTVQDIKEEVVDKVVIQTEEEMITEMMTVQDQTTEEVEEDVVVTNSNLKKFKSTRNSGSRENFRKDAPQGNLQMVETNKIGFLLNFF
jgi:hypothetical protein